MSDAEKSRPRKIARHFIRDLTVSNMAGSRLVLEGEISIKSFILGLSVLIIPLIRTSFGHIDWVFDYLTGTPGKIVIAIYIAIINGLLLIVYKGPLYKVKAYLPVSLRLLAWLFAESEMVIVCVCFLYLFLPVQML